MRGYLDSSPELLVEVSGSSSHRDLEVKFDVYRRNGVQKYLLWDTVAEEFRWFLLENGEYLRLPPDDDGIFRSRVFPGLWLDAAELLNGNLQRVLQQVQQGCQSPEHADFIARLKRAESRPNQ